MASAGVAALSAVPAMAQPSSECTQGLDRIEQQLQQAEVDEQRRADVDQVIEGARTLAETGDEEGCTRVLAELEKLMKTLVGAGGGQAAQGGRQRPQGTVRAMLGVGDEEVAVSLDRFEVGADRRIVLAGVIGQALQDMPKRQEGDPSYESLAR